jgi:hypothetical protein
VVAVGVPHHITQRGNNRQDVFPADTPSAQGASGSRFLNRRLSRLSPDFPLRLFQFLVSGATV